MPEQYEAIRVGRWMSADVVSTRADAVLGDALDQMTELRTRHLPVVEGGALVGLLSNRDASRVANKPAPRAGFRAVDEMKVADVMTPGDELKTVSPLTHVRDAAETICREKISALPVVEGRALVGIVTSEDLLWAFLETPEEPSED